MKTEKWKMKNGNEKLVFKLKIEIEMKKMEELN